MMKKLSKSQVFEKFAKIVSVINRFKVYRQFRVRPFSFVLEITMHDVYLLARIVRAPVSVLDIKRRLDAP